MNAKKFMSMTEDQAREYLESLRWPNGPVCAHCGSSTVGKLAGKATRAGVYKCKTKGCRKQFTVTVGTIFERSHVKLCVWVAAFYMTCCSKKGVSALQLYRMLGIGSYKTAWFIAGRIRWAMRQAPLRDVLKGIVESDETYVGGKVTGPGQGPFVDKKSVVHAMIERGGNMRVKIILRVNAKNLRESLNEAVDKGAVLMTDEHAGYIRVGKTFADHQAVKHGAKEYARGIAHVNTAESWFALLKRGIHGTYHHVSHQHLFRYTDEFAWRFNQRKVTDRERTEAALRLAPGCRLVYQKLLG